MRMRKKRNLIPRMERCSELLAEQPEEYAGRWLESFPACSRLFVEIGCGKGRFTVETAELHPDVLFVAVERVNDAMVIAMERALDSHLQNVRFISGDAACLTQFFGMYEVDRIYINFCDPWPGKKHEKRRLTAPSFLHIYRSLLKKGADIHFKTDNAALFAYSIEQFVNCGFRLSELTRDLHQSGVASVMTDYEERFCQLGTPINRCVAIK